MGIPWAVDKDQPNAKHIPKNGRTKIGPHVAAALRLLILTGARLREILPKWKEPLYIGDEERQKIAASVMLSIKTDNGHHRNYTVQIENHSKFDVEVKCITLWNEKQKVSKPSFPPENVRWSVPAHRTVPIQFDAQEDVAQRLWQLAGYPEDIERWTAKKVGFARQFEIEVRVELRCEILGIERDFEETRTVQVDFRNRQITGV